MKIREEDFYAICIDPDESFYSEISSLDKDLFNVWVRKNLKTIVKVKSYNDVLPSAKLFEKLTNLGYEHRYYQCHYSAKAATILNPDLRYLTGFVEVSKSLVKPIITHSFNIDENEKIVDFARINNKDYPLAPENTSFLKTYCGIEIPRDFVLKFKNETFGDKKMKPLLFEWYKECT